LDAALYECADGDGRVRICTKVRDEPEDAGLADGPTAFVEESGDEP
jgi:hypothetical protein